MKEYLCKLSNTGKCKYGGNKHYNYGFFSGTASYCYKKKEFLEKVKVCPLRQKEAV